MTERHSDTPIRETGEEVRAGEATGHMRYVLLISVVLAIVILSAIVWWPMLFGK